MQKTAMEGDLPFLPQEIIRNILIRLPVKSLVRFQCVNKHWQNLFKTPSFIADHDHQSRNHNPFLLFVCTCDGCQTLPTCLLDSEMQVLQLQNAHLIDTFLDATDYLYHSSNGLLCVERVSQLHSILLWNPAIKEVKLVPKAVDYMDFYVGFGFSRILNDCKIVRFYCDVEIQQVEVYSLSTGSWKEIELGDLGDYGLISEAFSTDGAIFWMGVKYDFTDKVVEGEKFAENDQPVVISFDIAMEVFTLMPMPDVLFNKTARFIVYEDKPALVDQTVIEGSESCLINLWVMEEGTDPSAERWSWSKKYTSNPYPCLLQPKTIWRNEIVCEVGPFREHYSRKTEGEMENGETKFVLCNLTNNEFKMFAIPSCGHSHRVLNYAESLISVATSPKF